MSHSNNSVDDDFVKSLQFTLDEIEDTPTTQPPQHPKKVLPSSSQPIHKNKTSEKIQSIKDQLAMVDKLAESDELRWIKDQLQTRSGHTFMKKVESLHSDLEQVKKNQEIILNTITQPIDLNSMVEKGQIVHLLEQNEILREEVRALTGRIEGLNSQVNNAQQLAQELRKAQHQLGETRALSDSIESLRNTTYMLNKKIDMAHSPQKLQELENKMKEIVHYLHQLNTRIQKQLTPQKPTGDYIANMGL